MDEILQSFHYKFLEWGQKFSEITLDARLCKVFRALEICFMKIHQLENVAKYHLLMVQYWAVKPNSSPSLRSMCVRVCVGVERAYLLTKKLPFLTVFLPNFLVKI